MYRDRSDGGKFKPLAELRARGFVDPPAGPSLSDARIRWGADQFPWTVDTTTVPTLTASGMNGPIPPENNPQVTVTDGVFRFTTTGVTHGISLGSGFWVPITHLPDISGLHDDRHFRVSADVKVTTMTGPNVVLQMNLFPAQSGAQAVAAPPMPSVTNAANFADFAPVSVVIPDDRMPALMAGASPAVQIICTLGGLFSAGDGGPVDFEVRNIRLECQEIVAGP
jgi:hypothetical protein